MRMMWSLMISLSLPFLAASFSLMPIQEYISKAKLLQKMSSSSWLYWHTTFLCDLIGYLPSMAAILLVFYLQDKNKLFVQFGESVQMLLLFLLMFGLTSMQISYVLSRSFGSMSTGFLAVVVFNLAFGVVLVMFDFFFDYLENTELTKTTRSMLDTIFSFFPIYAISHGISSLYLTGAKAHMCDHLYKFGINPYCNATYRPIYMVRSCCLDDCGELCFRYESPFTVNSDILNKILILAGVTVFAALLNIALEENLLLALLSFIPRIKRCVVIIRPQASETEKLKSEDSDVIQEKWVVGALVEKWRSGEVETKAMLVHHLTKTFGQNIAVDDLSFTLDERECFGLLGEHW